MDIMKGCVVKSVSGRDADRFYLVLAVDGGFALIADGKVRPIERPKRKNVKHLKKTNTVADADSFTTNKQLKALLHPFNYQKD